MFRNTIIALLATTIGAAAHAALIDFDNVMPGDVGVTITDTVGGAGCSVNDFGVQSDGLACAIFSDTDSSEALIDLGGTASALSLDFGNDDPGFTDPGDLAILETYLGGALVGIETVVLNRDDIMNQTISFAGAFFDTALFYYGRAIGDPNTGGNGTNPGLTEVIDNLNITFVAVDEPVTLGLFLSGLIAAGAARRRARSR